LGFPIESIPAFSKAHLIFSIVSKCAPMGAPFSPSSAERTDGRQQGKRRGELAREVMDLKMGSVRAQFLGGNRQIDGLQECVCGRAGL
jgi:hypothetical protein